MSEVLSFTNQVYVAQECKVYSTPIARREKLKELGIDEEALVEALQQGLVEKLSALTYDPPTAGGYDMYRYTTRRVRTFLDRAGWELVDRSNIAMVRDPIAGTSVVVCAGDFRTGATYGQQPKTKRSKGDVFLDVSEVIARDLFGEDVVVLRRIAPEESKTWLLLHYHEVIAGEHHFRAELSRPAQAEGGVINSWFERIILNIPLPGSILDDETADDSGVVVTPTIQVRL